MTTHISGEDKLDWLFNRLSEVVSGIGPKLLTRGMHPIEANEALLACLETMHKRIELADKIFELLPCYNTGTSFLAEERVKALVEEYWELGGGSNDRSNNGVQTAGV